MILDRRGRVLVLERTAIAGARQFPQGGIERGETPRAAILREIAEETGIRPRALTLIAKYPEPLVYELPARAQKEKTGLGQVQYWFFFQWRGPLDDLPSLPPDGEFRAAAWVPFRQAVSTVVAFKRPVYEKLGRYLRQLRADRRRPVTGSARTSH